MKRIEIKIKTTKDYHANYEYLFGLWNELNEDNLDVRFDFSSCSFFTHNAICFLGGMSRLIQYKGGKVEFAWETMSGWLSATLTQNGFRYAFEKDSHPWNGTSIPYREDNIETDFPWPAKEISTYLENDWLGKGCISMSIQLKKEILGRVMEVFLNAFEHSSSPIGVFSCGQYYPTNQKLSLCVIDFGVGIPNNVRHFENDPQISASKAMERAFSLGYTTKINGIPKGLGLDILKEFIKVNNGDLCVYSHDGFTHISNNGEVYEENKVPFTGTLVNITLHCDNKYYFLKNER